MSQSPFVPIQPNFKGDLEALKTPIKADFTLDKPQGESFQNIFMGFLDNANESQWNAGSYTKALTTGQLTNTHEMTIAGSKSEVMLHLVTQVASKLSSAATTLFQMQI